MMSVQAIWRDLRIVSGRVCSWESPVSAVRLPIAGGAYGSNLVLAATDTVASASDNREKLAKSGALERHLAAYVDRSATSILIVLRDFDPPSEPPDLPAAMTDVYLFSVTYADDRYVVWRAGENRRWQRFQCAAGADNTEARRKTYAYQSPRCLLDCCDDVACGVHASGLRRRTRSRESPTV